jgi:hypothetical protein
MTVPTGDGFTQAGHTDAIQPDYTEDITPVDVRIIEDRTALETYTAEFGAYQTVTVPVTGTNMPVQILQRRMKRHRAIIIVQTLAANYVVLNSSQAALSSLTPQGYQLVVSQQLLEVKNQEALYAIAVGTSAIISILDEGWR